MKTNREGINLDPFFVEGIGIVATHGIECDCCCYCNACVCV